MTCEKEYAVHELAELSGCTVRTLHHYDELGLVRARRAANGYRRYGPEEVDRLQQVLLY
ncbi:MAG: MerR family DNA-binding transcriptional regulator, partial [Eggerthellaceae bacterium]